MGKKQKKPTEMVMTPAGIPKPKTIKPKLAIIAMVILLIFIILPPVFRMAFPANVINDKDDISKIEIKVLSCDRFILSTLQRVSSTITYENGMPLRNEMSYKTFEMNNNLLNFIKEPTIAVKTVEEELAYFQSLEKIDVYIGQDDTKVVIEDKGLSANSQDAELKNYMLGINEQKTRFEAQGYFCTIS